MALEVGSRLGHYDVTALIGEGGMGQVYQVRDVETHVTHYSNHRRETTGIHGRRCLRRRRCCLKVATHDGERLLYLMSLEPGTTLSPYSVTAKIGEGGMGEA